MSFEIYVGNYPTDFTKEDVQKLFASFDGVELLKICKRDKKCYSFFSCKDINQLVSVVQMKNNSLVCGRRLKVRASDEDLQCYVNILLQPENNGTHNFENTDVSLVPVQAMKNELFYQDKYNSKYNECETSSRNSYSQPNFSNFNSRNKPEAACSNEIDTFVDTPKSKDPYFDHKKYAWVSVTNFPIGTNYRSLYKLFSDYNPVKIVMVCNNARKDKTITEAQVCFNSPDVANDVILNFDNTIFHGRVILVNDIDDLTIMNELLSVSLS